MPKMNYFLIGPMGSGKSTIGARLAKRLQMPFHDTDREIELRLNNSIATLFKTKGEAYFRIHESNILAELSNKTGIVLATGGGIINGFNNRCCLVARGKIIYLKASVNSQTQRLQGDTHRPLLQYYSLEQLANQRNSFYEGLADCIVESDKQTPNQIVDQLYQMIVEKKL